MNPGEFAHLCRCEERMWWFRGMRRITDLLLSRYCPAPPGAPVLEAGCGTGFESARLVSHRQWRIFPVDLSPVAAGHARSRGLPVANADILSLPFPEGAFAGLLSLDVLVHLDEEAQLEALREFRRVLRPGGWLMARCSALRVLRSRHSQWAGERHRVRRAQLCRQAQSAGLRVRFASYANSLLLPVALAKFRLWEPLTRAPVASGVEMPPGWLNALLETPLLAESAWFALGGRFPLGQSVYLVAERP